MGTTMWEGELPTLQNQARSLPGARLPIQTDVQHLHKRVKREANVYVGESARTPFDRGAEHLKLMEREDKESPAVEHTQEEHPGQETSFSMEVINFPRTTLQRQAMEGH